VVRRGLRLLTVLVFTVGLFGLAASLPACADLAPHSAAPHHCPGHAQKHPCLGPAYCIACTLIATLAAPQTVVGSPVVFAVAFASPAPEPKRGIVHRPDPLPPKARQLG
jgi:hypothetical protein